jgi:hypothetical protein
MPPTSRIAAANRQKRLKPLRSRHRPVAAAALVIKSPVIKSNRPSAKLALHEDAIFICDEFGPAFVPSDLNGHFFNFSS